MINQYKLNKELNCYEIELYDNNYNLKDTVLIDIEDYDRVKEYNWYKNTEGTIVATNKNRPRLGKLILSITDKPRAKVQYRNLNKSDNRKCNLFCLDPNNENSKYTGITGVSKRNISYEVYITYQQKRIYLGSSKDLYEAISMRKRAEYELGYTNNKYNKKDILLYIPEEGYEINFNKRTAMSLNEYKWNNELNCYEMNLYNKINQVIGVALIDKEDYEKVKHFKWGFNGKSISSRIGGKQIKLHRFILNAQEYEIIDHINSNMLDNRKCNLKKISTNKSSIINIPGVERKGQMYHAMININGMNINLGWFFNLDQAIFARRQAEWDYGIQNKSPLKYGKNI